MKTKTTKLLFIFLFYSEVLSSAVQADAGGAVVKGKVNCPKITGSGSGKGRMNTNGKDWVAEFVEPTHVRRAEFSVKHLINSLHEAIELINQRSISGLIKSDREGWKKAAKLADCFVKSLQKNGINTDSEGPC